MVGCFNLAERVLRVSCRRCRLKPEMTWQPKVECNDVHEENGTGQDAMHHGRRRDWAPL